MEELKNIQSFTVEEFQKNFDSLMERVENGETFIIKSEYGNVVIVPYDEVVHIHTEHEEGT